MKNEQNKKANIANLRNMVIQERELKDEVSLLAINLFHVIDMIEDGEKSKDRIGKVKKDMLDIIERLRPNT
jgi:hypothetical protein